MSKLVGEWMKKKGLQLVKERKERTAESAKVDNADDIPFVDKLIEFHSVCDSLVRKHFPAASPRAGVQATEMPPHPMYLRTMTSAWESIVNPPVTLKPQSRQTQRAAGGRRASTAGSRASPKPSSQWRSLAASKSEAASEP